MIQITFFDSAIKKEISETIIKISTFRNFKNTFGSKKKSY